MILEVKQWPESQDVMDKPEWFFICGISDRTGGDGEYDPIGDSAYARILHEDEHKCPKCKSIHPVHTVSDLSDGSWHEVKDGSTTIIPDPFKKE
jgi:hypothetical protein|tara:strand:- start:295 stop:576 length:282 start_codon:yes stop_codon:yes gene_type:complete